MRSLSILTAACVLSIADAVNMSRYTPLTGVEPAFKAYLQELYNQTEIRTADQTFYNFFQPPGTLKIINEVFVGHDEIIAEKKRLLPPPPSNKFWSHFPNITFVYQDNPVNKTYEVWGIINSLYVGEPNNNCSAAYFKSHFTIAKKNGTIDLTPHTMNLLVYDDFIIDPPYSPTNITCAT